MATWTLRWNFNKSTYSPGECGNISFWLENSSNNILFVSDIGIQFDWMENKFYHVDCGNQISPQKNDLVSVIDFEIPPTKVGQVVYNIYYHLYEFDRTKKQWIDLGERWTGKKHFINIFPTPFYKAFISRGLRPEDQAIGDPIVRLIRCWGFETTTVGIEKIVKDYHHLSPTIRNEIINADCLIAIATPRYLDAFSGLWRTLEWLQSEVGIAYGVNKPIIIIKQKDIILGGLPSTFKNSVLEFDPTNIEDLERKLSILMPSLRDCIATKKNQEFFQTLGAIAMGAIAIGGALLVGGIAGYVLGSTTR